MQCKAGLFAPVGDSGFRMSERKVSAPATGAEHLADVLAPFSRRCPTHHRHRMDGRPALLGSSGVTFHRKSNGNKGATRVRQQAKASSAGSTEAGGNSRGLFRRALATRGASSDAKGSGARSSVARLRATLAVLALAIAAFAITAAPALAAPPTVSTPTVEPSYTSVRVEGKVTTDGSGLFTQTIYGVEYSTDGTNWIVGPESTFGSNIIGPAEHKPVATIITGLKSGTEYFVRLRAWNVPGFIRRTGSWWDFPHALSLL